jgi:hypothetical protein
MHDGGLFTPDQLQKGGDASLEGHPHAVPLSAVEREIKRVGALHRELSRFLALSVCPTDALNTANR